MLRSANRMTALVAGAAFAALGLAGLLTPGSAGFFAPEGALLFGILSTNPALGVLHLLVAAALVAGAIAGLGVARAVNSWTGALLLALGLFGLFAVGTPVNVLALNGPGNVVHFGASVLLLAVGLGAERRRPS